MLEELKEREGTNTEVMQRCKDMNKETKNIRRGEQRVEDMNKEKWLLRGSAAEKEI